MDTDTQAAEAADSSAMPEAEYTAPEGISVIFDTDADSGEDANTEQAPNKDAATEQPAKTQEDAKPADETAGEDQAADSEGQDENETRTQRRRRQRRESAERDREEADKSKAEIARLKAANENLKPTDPLDGDYDATLAENAAKAVATQQNNQRISELEAQDAQQSDKVIKARQEAWEDQLSELGHIEDLKTTLESPDFNVSVETASICMDEDITKNGAAILYQLANDPGELARLEAMPVYARVAEVARLEAKLPALKPKTKSDAPEPLDTVTGKNTSTDIDLETASFADYVKARGLD